MEKKLYLSVEKVQKSYPDANVEVWSMDEHRLGLKPVVRKVWSEQGLQPIARVKWRFKWLWLYGFVQPETGETYWWILPFVNIELFNKVLADFANHFEVGKKKRIILVLDQAGWHYSDKVKIPEGIHFEFIPSHSPELQPAERLWPITNEGIANSYFSGLDELEDAVYYRCQKLLNLKELIKGLTCFYWWPKLSINQVQRKPFL